jgi:hypothetical protein
MALRAVSVPAVEAWWVAARERTDMPRPVATLLNGRRRIEIGADEAEAVLLWASAVEGWADAEPKPLFLYAPS